MLLICMINVYHQSVMAQKTSIPEDYTWKNRLVLLFAPHDSSKLLQQQYTALQSDPEGLNNRDLLIFKVSSDQVIGHNIRQGTEVAQQLRNQYQVGEDDFCAILIGKDGSEKIRKEREIPLNELYAVIDAMPMRRQEMKKESQD